MNEILQIPSNLVTPALLAAETSARATTDALLDASRLAAVAQEAFLRAAGLVAVNNRIDTLTTVASTSGGTGVTSLTRQAGAAAIAEIGGDGTTITVLTEEEHGYVDGDYIVISGTTNYNSPALTSHQINVISTNQFTFARAIAAVTETVGFARTGAIYVADISQFVQNQQITITNDAGELHTTTITGTPTAGVIRLTTAVPTTWTEDAVASIGAVISTTLEEVRLARLWAGGPEVPLPRILEYAANGKHNALRWLAADGETDDRAAWQEMFDAGAGSTTTQEYYYPPRTYVIASSVAYGNQLHGIQFPPNSRHIWHPDALVVVRDGASVMPVIAPHGHNNISIIGMKVKDERTSRVGGDGMAFINTSDLNLEWCETIDWPHYGIGLYDDVSGPSLVSSTISYSGHTISDPAGGLGDFTPGELGISGTLFNNRVVTITDVTPTAITVLEDLTTEAAAASRSYARSVRVSIDAETNTIRLHPVGTDYDASFATFLPRDQIITAGFANAANNQTLTILDLDEDSITVVAPTIPLVDEPIGATVTITKVGRSRLQQMNALAVENVSVRHCTTKGSGHIGYEFFPKKASRNLDFSFNLSFNNGHKVVGGCGIKVGTAFTNAMISNNWSIHDNSGIILGLFDIVDVHHNTILNSARYGIALGISPHMRYEAPLNVLSVHDNILATTVDFFTGLQYVSPFASSAYRAINITGISTTNGLIDISRNRVYKWPAGIGVYRIQRSHPGMRFQENLIVDSGNSIMIPVQGLATTTNDSPILTAVKDTAGNLTLGGWTFGSEVHMAGVPQGARVIDMDATARTLTLNMNATADGTNVPVYSAYLKNLDFLNNRFINTDNTKNPKILIYGDRSRIVGLQTHGYGEYQLTIGGSGFVKNYIATNPNPTLVANRGIISIANGNWTIDDVYADVREQPTALVFMINNTLATTLYVTNVRASEEWVRPLFATTPIAATGYVMQFGKNRITYGTTAPSDLTKNRMQDDIHIKIGTTNQNGISHWKCTVSGSIGQDWRAYGNGSGTTGQRPVLGAFDKGYFYYDTTTSQLLLWNGTTWVVT